MKGQEACNYLAKHPLSITDEEAREIDEKLGANYAAKAEKKWDDNHAPPKFRDLDPKFQTVLTSRSVNSATAVNKNPGMAAFNAAAANGNTQDGGDKLSNVADSIAQPYIDAGKKVPPIVGRLQSEADFLDP